MYDSFPWWSQYTYCSIKYGPAKANSTDIKQYQLYHRAVKQTMSVHAPPKNRYISPVVYRNSRRNGTLWCKSPPKVLVSHTTMFLNSRESSFYAYCPMNTRCVIIVTQRGCALDKGFSAPSMEYLFVGLKKSLQGKNRYPHCLSPIVRWLIC
jgi:hypothetical protein